MSFVERADLSVKSESSASARSRCQPPSDLFFRFSVKSPSKVAARSQLPSRVRFLVRTQMRYFTAFRLGDANLRIQTFGWNEG